MVLNPVDVFFLGAFWDAEEGEECGENRMTFGNFSPDCPSFRCEGNGEVGFVVNETILCQALDHLCNGGLAELKGPRHIRRAQAPSGFFKIVESLKVVLLLHAGRVLLYVGIDKRKVREY